jgi:TonB family protein
MSLSKLCVEQHEREQAGLRKLLLLGLLGSVGMHAIAFGLSSLGIWQRTAQAELSPIELLVMEPPPEAIEEQPEVPPAEVSSETNNPAPAAMAQANPETAAAPAPPPPAELIEPEPQPEPEPEPEPIAETEVESELTEPEETGEPEEPEEEDPEETTDAVEEEEETTEAEEEPSEEVAVAPPELTESQLERLRNSFEGTAQEADPDATSTEAAATEGTESESTSTGESTDTAANSGAGTQNGNNASGDGTGQGQGSRTVACQNCALPQYPDSALDAGVEGTPRVQVDINPDGSVRSVTLVQSSGNAAIDQAAIQAARSSSFQPVTGGASVPIEYDLTIEGSRRNREAQRRGDRRSVEVPTENTETPPQTAADVETEETFSPAVSDEETGVEQDSNLSPESASEATPPAESETVIDENVDDDQETEDQETEDQETETDDSATNGTTEESEENTEPSESPTEPALESTDSSTVENEESAPESASPAPEPSAEPGSESESEPSPSNTKSESYPPEMN